MEQRIQQKLRQIEERENVRILFAVEAGSRAWGFASPDSDYDVRFVYVRKKEDYLKLEKVRDVIEWQLDEVYDISGWDLQKALRLLHASNPSLFEWLYSPIVYRSSLQMEQMKRLGELYFSPRKEALHYLSMAEHTFTACCLTEQVKLKKYFYALRPVLAARWVLEHRNCPPVRFAQLEEACLQNRDVEEVVAKLLERKRMTSELGVQERIVVLEEYLREQIALLKPMALQEEKKKSDFEELNRFFRKTVDREE